MKILKDVESDVGILKRCNQHFLETILGGDPPKTWPLPHQKNKQKGFLKEAHCTCIFHSPPKSTNSSPWNKLLQETLVTRWSGKVTKLAFPSYTEKNKEWAWNWKTYEKRNCRGTQPTFPGPMWSLEGRLCVGRVSGFLVLCLCWMPQMRLPAVNAVCSLTRFAESPGGNLQAHSSNISVVSEERPGKDAKHWRLSAPLCWDSVDAVPLPALSPVYIYLQHQGLAAAWAALLEQLTQTHSHTVAAWWPNLRSLSPCWYYTACTAFHFSAAVTNQIILLAVCRGQDNVIGAKACIRDRDNVVIVMPHFPHDRFQVGSSAMLYTVYT